MNEEQQLIVETAKRIFADQCDKTVVDAAEAGQFPVSLWKTLADTGLTLAGVDAESGGSGGEWADALLLIREAGAAAAPIPLAEHLMAATLLARAGMDIPAGILTVATVDVDQRASNVAFTEVADYVVVVSDDSIMLLGNQELPWERSNNIAGESIAAANLNGTSGVEAALPGAAKLALQLGATTRSNLIAGAISEILAMSVQYVTDRQQFGRPLAKFQAIQHQLAVLAGEAAACQRSANSVLYSISNLDVAISKARTGEAVTLVSDIAHQVHGAIGYTLEHALNLRTRRLWRWRDEYGTERYWQIQIGHHFCRSGADQLWAGITNAG
jgi:acyl-CoA dehydrogenase